MSRKETSAVLPVRGGMLAEDLDHGGPIGVLQRGQLQVEVAREGAHVRMHRSHAPQSLESLEAIAQPDDVQKGHSPVLQPVRGPAGIALINCILRISLLVKSFLLRKCWTPPPLPPPSRALHT